MRLNKYIASAGLCSRRKADEMINEGRVKVNGLEVTEHGFQVEEGSVVEVDGQVVTVSTKPPVYLMMNTVPEPRTTSVPPAPSAVSTTCEKPSEASCAAV